MSQQKLAACAFTTIAFVASGCGSSSTTTSSHQAASTPATSTANAISAPRSGKPLARNQLIAQADAICARTNVQAGTMSARTGAESMRILPQIVIYYRTEAESLSKLVPPSSMARDWTRIVHDIQQYSSYTNTAVQYAKDNRLPAAQHIYQRAITLLERWPATAKRDGFKQCSKLR